MRHALALGSATLALVGCASPLSDVQEARARLEAEVTSAETADEIRREALVAAVDGHVGGDTPCARSLAEAPLGVQTVAAAELADTPGPRLEALRAVATPLHADLMIASAPTAEQAAALVSRVDGALQPVPWDATFVVTSRSVPSFESGVYLPGVLEGYVAVWDYAARAVVCASAVHVTNSPDVLDQARADEAAWAAFEADPAAHLLADLTAVAHAEAEEGLAAVR